MSQVLLRAKVNRVIFNPSNAQHLKSLEVYIRTGNWGDVQFIAEPPFIDVPMCVLMSFTMHKLKVHRETAVEQELRLSDKTNVIRFIPAIVESERSDFRRSEIARRVLKTI